MQNEKSVGPSIKLSPRLQVIANKVVRGSRIADIGTDHAYIPIYLVLNDIAGYAVASDVRKGPVQKAKNNVMKYRLADKIDVRLGNGLEKISDGEADTVIIAGMGGVLISDILSNGKEGALKSAKRLILQPNIGQEEVRKWLVKNHYTIIDEELADEGNKLYNVIAAEPGQQKIDKEIYYYIGEKLVEKKDPLLEKLIIFKIDELKKILYQLQDVKTDNAVKRVKECQARLYEYRELLKSI